MKRSLARRSAVSAFALAAALQGSLLAFGGGTASADATPITTTAAAKSPKVIIISLDGARPDVIEKYLANGVLKKSGGLGLVRTFGSRAVQNTTATPSLTAVSHIAIATGSTAVHNDIPANTFHLLKGTPGSSISGFSAPIGGYSLDPLGADPSPTAEPLWVQLRNAGKNVVTATWPGGDGLDVKLGTTSLQAPSPDRTVDYTLPFGAFGGLSAAGFILNAGNFAPDASVEAELAAAGHPSFSPVKATTAPIETFYCSSTATATCSTFKGSLDLTFQMNAAALDSTDDGVTNYDTLVFYEKTAGIAPGPFVLPDVGPAYVQAGQPSQAFFFAGSGNKVGAAYYATAIAPDLSSVRFARYGAGYIPRNPPVVATVDDINDHVGFWRPQPDYRIPERLTASFAPFSDLELEQIYEDQVRIWTGYQTRVANRAIRTNRDADLVMIYFEQPDGSSHQFWLTDPRQASNPTDPNSIGANQDPAKVARYKAYREYAYQRVDRAVHEVLQTAGLNADGSPRSNVFIVSDHGFAPFHTAVNIFNLLTNAGVNTSKLTIKTSGPAANIYVNLQGREPGGTVAPEDYNALVLQVRQALTGTIDSNPTFNYTLANGKVFTQVSNRPFICPEGIGYCTSPQIGQDFGDVFAIMAFGYNFDGTQSPVVQRQGDPAAATPAFSVPNFYGAHGYTSTATAMSATFYAAGPAIKTGVTVPAISNIDVAPTIMQILGVAPSTTVDGKPITAILK